MGRVHEDGDLGGIELRRGGRGVAGCKAVMRIGAERFKCNPTMERTGDDQEGSREKMRSEQSRHKYSSYGRHGMLAISMSSQAIQGLWGHRY